MGTGGRKKTKEKWGEEEMGRQRREQVTKGRVRLKGIQHKILKRRTGRGMKGCLCPYQ